MPVPPSTETLAETKASRGTPVAPLPGVVEVTVGRGAGEGSVSCAAIAGGTYDDVSAGGAGAQGVSERNTRHSSASTRALTVAAAAAETALLSGPPASDIHCVFRGAATNSAQAARLGEPLLIAAIHRQRAAAMAKQKLCAGA